MVLNMDFFGGYWWLPLPILQNTVLTVVNQLLANFLFRDTKSARDKNGTKPRKNKVKNTLPEISLVEYLCFVCKVQICPLKTRGNPYFSHSQLIFLPLYPKCGYCKRF